MRALSIIQPWPWLVVQGFKDIENRSWKTNFRGEFLIHAGKKLDLGAYAMADDLGIAIPATDTLDYGGIIGIAEIVDCVTRSDSKWFFGPYGFVIRNARPLPFRPFRGMQGFFEVPDEVKRPVRADVLLDLANGGPR